MKFDQGGLTVISDDAGLLMVVCEVPEKWWEEAVQWLYEGCSFLDL